MPQWLMQHYVEIDPHRRAEWSKLGYRAILGDRGVSVLEVVQLRAWPSSSVLRVHASGGDFYFKAVAQSIRRECAVTTYLAEHFPGRVPEVVAVDLTRRWLLLRAASGCKLEEIGTAAPWEHAARMYARLQVESRDHAGTLRACGASERGLAHLTRRLDQLAAAHEEVRSIVPALRSHAAQLETYGIPPLLEHGDLWPGNFLVDDSSNVLIDWEDVAVGEPPMNTGEPSEAAPVPQTQNGAQVLPLPTGPHGRGSG